MSQWQDLSTAPKDETKIDLWVINSSDPIGYRIPDCRRQYAGGAWPDVWIDSKGYYVNSSHYYNDEGDGCLQLGNEPHPKARSWTKVTHWMAKPAPPHSVPEKDDGR